MDLDTCLQKMVAAGSSDLFITAGFPVSAKVNGKMTPLASDAISADQALTVVQSAMNAEHSQQFTATKECNFAIVRDGIGRFRCSAFWQRDCAGMVIRRIVTQIPKVDDLGLPEVLKDIIMSKRGLILFVGATGTGKSTSLAALIGHRKRHSAHGSQER